MSRVADLSTCMTIASEVRDSLMRSVGRSTFNCIFASLVLADRLAQATKTPVQAVRGEVFIGAHEDHQDHWWVEVQTDRCGPVVIDITADQFNHDVGLGVQPFWPVHVEFGLVSPTHYHKDGVASVICVPGRRGAAETSRLISEMASEDCRSYRREIDWRRASTWAADSVMKSYKESK